MTPDAMDAATELSMLAPSLSRWHNVRAGTAGWTDKTLIKSGLFYPKGTSDAASRLDFYAHHFTLVEVDATYYTLLPPATAEKWVANTPGEFVFDVKSHPVLTGHPIDVTRMPGDLRGELERLGHDRRVYPDRLPEALAREIEARFRALVDVLAGGGRLGCVMLQLPPWTTATRGNVRRLEVVAERWSDVPLAVEFRHPSWLAPERRERVFELLARHRLSYVCVDEPDVVGGGVPPAVAVTNTDLAIVRFHGHNVAGWHKGASVEERFDYLYSPEELRAWVAPVKRLAEEAREVHAVFNNCVRNYAVLGAKDLVALLAEEPGTVPDTDSSVAGKSPRDPG
jgi:uncharacterized protein YecE (DUF72 family)